MTEKRKALRNREESKSRDIVKDTQKHFDKQLIRVFNSLLESPKTMWEASVNSGVVRANVCRHVATLRKQKRVAVIRKRPCKISGHLAGELTANPELFPRENQLNLFYNE